MTIIGIVKKIDLNEAVAIIHKKRPDFKIGAIFLFKSDWYAVHNDGENSTRLICIKVNKNKDIEGINPFAISERDDFFYALNNEAFNGQGEKIGTQMERERKESDLPSDNYEKEIKVKNMIKNLL